MDKTKSPNPKGPTAPAVPSPKPAAPTLPNVPVPPLFRTIDWLTFGITFLVVMAGYYWTLATNLGLEDSGELAVGSMYAGIPHPPGYPVWTMYTWLWSLLPVSNIAFRVALGGAFAGAVACGLLGLIVSRGSSMLMEGIEELKAMTGKWESAICVVSGFVSGGLLGFNGFMWSQAVIVEVYSLSVLSLVAVLLFLLRWMYAPEQKRYLYWAFFMFGICFTNHQSLLVAAMGLEVAIIVARPALGRDFLFINSLVYLIGLLAKAGGHLPNFDSPPGQTNMMFVIFNLVGLASIVGCGWLFVRTQKMLTEWRPVLLAGLCFLVGVSFYLYMPIAGMSNPPMQWGYPRTEEGFWHALTRGQYEKASPTNFLNDPGRLAMQLGMLVEGVADEFSWVFVLIALVPFLFLRRMQNRERAWIIGITAIYLCLGVLLMILINPPPDRAARELVRVFFTASHVCVALLVGYGLTLIAAYMATHYAASRRWGLIGGGVALALAVFALATVTESMFGSFFGGIAQAFAPQQYGLPVFSGLLLMSMVLVFIASLLCYRTHAPLAIALAMFAMMPGYSFMKNWFDNEQRGHMFGYWFGHDMFTPPFTGPDGKLSYDPKLRAEMMKDPEKAKLIYPEMTRNAVLYGGTDPGRFCPTYTIFCESFIPPRCKQDTDPLYDRRDVYIITQNALADGTYLMYIRAHYNKSDQIQYDAPFFQELLRSERESKENYKTNFLARLAGTLLDKPFTALGDYIEKQRRAGSSFFKEGDFTGDLAGKLRAQGDPLSKYLFENLKPATQKLLSDPADARSVNRALAADLNVLLERELVLGKQIARKRNEKLALEDEFLGSQPSERQSRKLEALKKEIEDLSKQGPLYEPTRFAHVPLSDYLKAFIRQNPQSHTRIRLNRMLLEEAYPGLIAKSPGGVYPDREILIATPEDSQRCFQTYLEDAQRRLKMNPPQLKPGEDVRLVGEGPNQRVQVSGQVAVMSINGLLTKVMFDKNPENEFFVEESFPLDWMYEYLTPFGIIMKINRNPLPELTEDILVRDHEFWAKYSERLIGNWITYDTPVKDIVKFVEKVYLKRDFTDFKGDLKFARDDQAQKAFSKLRSSIGGVFAWRVSQATGNVYSLQDQLRRSPVQNQAALQAQLAHWTALRERMIKETDFAFRQAFAFCPYSPEAVFRYCQLLISLNRLEDAYLIAETCRKLDPYNAQVVDLVNRLSSARGAGATGAFPPQPASLSQLEAEVASNPADFQKVLNLAATHLGMSQTNRAVELLDGVLNHPKVDAQAILALAQAYISVGNYPRLEAALEKLVKLSPTQPEAWYDLAALKAQLHKPAEVLPNLRQALTLSAARLKTDPKQKDLRAEASNDWRFDVVRQNAEFRALLTAP